MKLKKEELLKKISESGFEDEIAISLMEDVADSFMDPTPEADLELVKNLEAAIEELDAKYQDLLAKYKARFLAAEEVIEESPDPEEDEDREEVIDVKEI